METMKRFSEKELEYDLYERRRLAVMDAKAMQAYTEELETQLQAQQAEMQTQQAELEKVRKEKERERAEKERLLYLLKQSGIDPGFM